jgi:radical SAM protein with 4Fe4S-binding SPASM domain
VTSSVLSPGGFRPTMPLHMVWIATNGCNARCLHCSSNSSGRTADELNTAQALDMIDQLAAGGVLDLAISGGEPLLRRDLFAVVARARARGMSVGIGTNGARLSRAQATSLAQSGINRLQVSLDGLAHEHDQLRGWPGLFDLATRTIHLAHDAGVRVHVCCTITRLNEAGLDAFANFVSTLPVARINFSRYVPTGRGTDGLDLSDGEWQAVTTRIQQLREHYRGRLEIVGHLAQQILLDPDIAQMPAFIGCQAGAAQGCITANGDVLPCVLLPVPVGNICERPFTDIWLSSPVLRSLRDRSSIDGKCGTCVVRERCGGCRAVAYARTGDYLAEDPRCWLPASDLSASPRTHTA